MSDNNNWITKELITDMEFLTDIPKESLDTLFKIVENLIIHRFVEEINKLEEQSDLDDVLLNKDFEIVLPYIGSVIVSLSDKESKSLQNINFVLKPDFYKKLKNSFINRTSPLVEELIPVLSKELLTRFEEGKSKGQI